MNLMGTVAATLIFGLASLFVAICKLSASVDALTEWVSKRAKQVDEEEQHGG
jgi:predicted PurR-regulated permease PerM